MTGIYFRKFLFVSGILAVLLAPFSFAQEGHPFDGTWRGTMENASGDSERVLLIMEYDGEELGGMINPGPNTVRIQDAELDAPNWRLQVEALDRNGETIAFAGTLNEIGSRNRYIEGTWTQGGEEYRFRVTRE